MKITKKALVAFLKQKLRTDDMWAARALTVIYASQTHTEKECEGTIAFNGVGFTGCDAKFLTGLAKHLEQYHVLTDRQMTFLKRGIAKYWKQILAVADMGKLRAMYQNETLQLELKLR